MFSGIVEEIAIVVAINKEQENVNFTLKCSFVNELKIDQSISHNGVCLTVIKIKDNTYTVTAMKETLKRSNLGLLKIGDKVNVERSMLMNARLDGHIVQGHVDEPQNASRWKTLEDLLILLLNIQKTKKWHDVDISQLIRALSPSMVFP
jgi:riboflavin synthase alpha subunit